MSLRKKALQRIDLQCLDVGIWEYHQGDDCSWDLGKVKSQYENIDEFRKLVDFAISRDTLKLEDVLATLNFRELLECGQKAKGDGGEGLYVRGRSAFNEGLSQCYVMAYGVEELLDWIMDSGGSYHITYMRDYLVDFEEYDGGNILLGDGREMRNRGLSSKIKVIKGSLVVLSGRRRANCVYTLDGQDVKSRFHKQKYEEWESPNILGVLVTTGLNGLVKETNVTLLAKVLASIKQGMLEPVKVKCIFLGYRKGTGSVQVLQGVEFEVEPQEDHTFEVEPRGNVDHVAGSQEAVLKLAFVVAEAEKIYAHESLTFNNTVACEVISKWKAGLKDDMDARSDVYVLSNGCKKCSDDNDVYYWEYTPAESGYKGLLDKAKGNVLGIEIISLLRDCDVEKNGKWSCIYAVGSQEYQMVCTRLDIASADVGMLDKFDRGLQTDVHVFVDFDYTMGRSITVMGRSITRYGLMIQGCVGSWEAMMMHMMALSPTEAGYMTLTEAAKEAIWLKGLAIESGFELKIVAGIATGALSKAIPGLRFQHRLNLLSISKGYGTKVGKF
ncbi:hypothetical protein Tco_1504334 [Tanacetum coccineum]